MALDRRFSICAGELYVIPARAPHSFHGALSPEASGWVFNLVDRLEVRDTKKVVARLDQPRAADLSGWLNRIVVEQRNGDLLIVASFAIVTLSTLASGLMFAGFFTAGQVHALRERMLAAKAAAASRA